MCPSDQSPAPAFRIERGARWNALVLPGDRPVLSSAPVNGGDVRARRVVNLCVDGPAARRECADPAATVRTLARREGWSGRTVGLMTAVAAAHLGVAQRGPVGTAWTVLATVGLTNAHRAGRTGPRHEGAGTINLIAVTAQGLTPAARAEALLLMAEAKATALADADIRLPGPGELATGTGTDAAAVVAGYGEDRAWTGHHTASGQALAAAVMAAMAASLLLGAEG